jgi:secreted trypsin-like serine protease
MRRSVAGLVLVLTLLLSAPADVAGVTYGTLDGGTHPYVGLMVAQDATGSRLWRCSGTLVAPRIFLTAGHCTHGATRAQVWFGADLTSVSIWSAKGDVAGRTYTHPRYDPRAFYAYDLGLVKLDRAVRMPAYGRLPGLDALDRWARERAKATFTSVGYGVQRSFPDAASWKEQSLAVRMVATPRLIQINGGIAGDSSLILSNNPVTGGTCFGDSGGPNFVGTTSVIAGVTSFAMNGTCSGTGGVYRIDRADDLGWLATFGVRP